MISNKSLPLAIAAAALLSSGLHSRSSYYRNDEDYLREEPKPERTYKFKPVNIDLVEAPTSKRSKRRLRHKS